jgi:hypothetical protein
MRRKGRATKSEPLAEEDDIAARIPAAPVRKNSLLAASERRTHAE